jgi:hypothetical protein
VLLASFCVLMHRYTGREDIVIGSVSAGRDREQLEPQIGPYLNTVVLRVPVRNTATVADVIDAVAQASTQALEHASYPFDALLDDLKIRTPANHSPIFDIQANHVSMPAPQSGLRITDVSPPDTTAKFDLSFQVVESAGTHLIQFIYNTHLFRAATIAAMRDRLLAIHDAFRRDPAMPIDRIALSSDAPAGGERVRVGLRLKRTAAPAAHGRRRDRGEDLMRAVRGDRGARHARPRVVPAKQNVSRSVLCKTITCWSPTIAMRIPRVSGAKACRRLPASIGSHRTDRAASPRAGCRARCRLTRVGRRAAAHRRRRARRVRGRGGGHRFCCGSTSDSRDGARHAGPRRAAVGARRRHSADRRGPSRRARRRLSGAWPRSSKTATPRPISRSTRWCATKGHGRRAAHARRARGRSRPPSATLRDDDLQLQLQLARGEIELHHSDAIEPFVIDGFANSLGAVLEASNASTRRSATSSRARRRSAGCWHPSTKPRRPGRATRRSSRCSRRRSPARPRRRPSSRTRR